MKCMVLTQTHSMLMSHPARGVWIEIFVCKHSIRNNMSHPARGGWIEICHSRPAGRAEKCHTPQGVCGLKFTFCFIWRKIKRHTPQGVCGLKCGKLPLCHKCPQSHPARGVWIEMATGGSEPQIIQRHTPQGVCGLKSLFPSSNLE